MKEIYIHSTCSISIQKTTEEGYFFEEITEYAENGIPVINPDYKEFIPALQLRRMGKSMRMAVYASQKAIADAGNPTIDAVITGTGEGCLRDSEKFVEALWENKEGGMLNPTPFIQSTHNMAAATVALALGCKGYNMTYTNNSNSFESALLDGQLYLNEHHNQTILIGGLDEISEKTTEFWSKYGWLKKEGFQIPIDLKSNFEGEIVSEGAGFLVASVEKPKQYLGKISGVKTAFEVQNPDQFVQEFLQENDLNIQDIDGIILGNNGDSKYDEIYQTLSKNGFAETPQIVYKHLLGEFDTVTSIAVEIGLKILNRQDIPKNLHSNNINRPEYKTILIYNQRRGQNHSAIILRK